MKKQIISLLVLISLSFQVTYCALDPVEKKREDSISWWKIRKLRDAEKKEGERLDYCAITHCKQQRNEVELADKERRQVVPRRKTVQGTISEHLQILLHKNHPAFKKYEEKQKSYVACLQKHCMQEYVSFRDLHKKLYHVQLLVLITAGAALGAIEGLVQAFIGVLLDKYLPLHYE